MDKMEEALSKVLQREERRISGRMKRIYISHPYGGKQENKDHIETIIDQLIYEHPENLYVSPVHALGFLYNNADYDAGLRWCLELLNMCDEMWVFGDYLESRGCKAEITYALDKKKPFYIK